MRHYLECSSLIAGALGAWIALCPSTASGARIAHARQLAVQQAPADSAQEALDGERPPRERPRPTDERALFELFSASPGLEARFTEEKHLGLLAVPLRSRGRLYFLPPGHLTRVVEAPEPATVRITPSALISESRGATERIDLSRAPELHAFVTSLGDVLAGRREGLARAWSIDYRHDADDPAGWTLTLAPRTDRPEHEALGHLVDRLELTGAGQAVLRIDVREPNGDRTTTTIVAADPRRVFTDEERAALFGLSPVATDAEGAASGG